MKSIKLRIKMTRFLLVTAMIGTTFHAQKATAQQPVPTETQAVNASSRLRFGVVGGYALNQHTANFPELQGFPIFEPRTTTSPGPPNFTSGTGRGFWGGALIEIPLSSSFLLGVRGSYTMHNARITTLEWKPVLPPDGGASVMATIEHALQTRIAAVGLEPMLIWKPLPSMASGLNLAVGARVGWLVQTALTMEANLITPDFGSFMGGGRSLPPISGAIPAVQALNISALAAISYDIPLNAGQSLLLSPEVSSTLGVTGVSNGISWTMNQLRAGIALKFSPSVAEPPAPPKPVFIKPAVPVLAAKVKANGVQPDGSETSDVALRTQEIFSRSLRPLLPYIFFDGEGSTSIPERYALLLAQQTRSFSTDKLVDSEALTPKQHPYYHVLNIIAQRLRQYPKAKLTITGCTDGVTSENTTVEIARQRAFAVRRYLMEAWGIEATRLMTEAKVISSKPSLPLDEPDKIRENRRVELLSDVPQIIAPILLQDTARLVLPSVIRVKPTVESTVGVREWKMNIHQNGQVVKEWSGNGTPPITMDWTIGEAEGGALESDTPLTYTLTVTDNAGASISTPPQTIALRRDVLKSEVVERSNQKVIDRYSLILFDFAKSELSSANQSIVTLIKQRLTEQAIVKITGFTDRTGNEDLNHRLSLARAQTAAQALGLTATAEINGYGSSVLLYDNDLPEGRFYCRTVRVIVETPLR